MFVKHTHYNAVKHVANINLRFQLTKDEQADWDVAWFDHPPAEFFYKQLKFHQRVNHFPGMFNLARKNMLGRHLMRMKRLLPQYFNFFPHTYMLPNDYKELVDDLHLKPRETMIIKPEDEA